MTRQVVDNVVQLLPAGTFSGRDGRGPYFCDCAAVVRESLRTLNGAPLPVDYGHAMEEATTRARAEAAGWISRLEVRPDGIYGTVDWTTSAQQKVADREYRYLSPVFLHEPGGRVTSLIRVGLTNLPNLRLKALHSVSNQSSRPMLSSHAIQLFSLDSEDIAYCVRQGIDATAFARTKSEGDALRLSSGALSEDEQFCQAMGIPLNAFLATRARSAAGG